MEQKPSVYFASDFHLGAPNTEESLLRERKIIRWLDQCAKDATSIILLGDLFDFWHEYDTVVPKGFVRFLGKLAELTDRGIHIEVFTGNHDLWMRDYFKTELNIPVYFEPETRIIGGKKFLIGHGDGLGPADKTYKYLRKVFHHPVSQFLFKWIHPDIGMRIANKWSASSRASHGDDMEFTGEDEWLVQYCRQRLKTEYFDYFIFGHRHLSIEMELNDKGSVYLNLGEWITQCSYAHFDGESTQLLRYE